MPKGDLWWDVLQQDPYQAYLATAGQWGTGRQKKWYEQNFQDVHSQYMSQIGNLMAQGTAPTEDFGTWLQKYNFGQNWRMMAPQLAGRVGQQAFNPFLQWAREGQRGRGG